MHECSIERSRPGPNSAWPIVKLLRFKNESEVACVRYRMRHSTLVCNTQQKMRLDFTEYAQSTMQCSSMIYCMQQRMRFGFTASIRFEHRAQLRNPGFPPFRAPSSITYM